LRRIDIDERRARLGVRHHLADGARAATVAEIAADLVGIHSSDPASVFLGFGTRMKSPDFDAVERALYDDRTVARILGMRRTMFVVPVDLVPTIHSACTRALAARERRRLIQMLEAAGLAEDGASWLRAAEKATLRAFAKRGEATATELSKDVPQLREQMSYGEGKKWAGVQGVSTRVLFLLATDGRIVRGRPRGSWISTQYRWVPIERWLGSEPVEPPTAVARVDLVRRWLERFGPGTVVDIKWWTGWTVTETKRALADVGAVEVDLDGMTGFVLPDDVETAPPIDPWAALLPALDSTVMGWQERAWYLGPHGPALFDRNGNAGPTVWWDGRIVGGWAQRSDGEIVLRLLDDVGADGRATIDAMADQLAAWLGERRVLPRFRTPLERELTA